MTHRARTSIAALLLAFAFAGCSSSSATPASDGSVRDANVPRDAYVAPDATATDAYVAGCSGTPSACSGLGSVQCAITTGCSAADAGGSSCTGTPDACTTFTGTVQCQLFGCTWTGNPLNGSCSGTPTACAGRNQALCMAGCTAVNACTGTADACSTKTSQGTCLAQGCTWQ